MTAAISWHTYIESLRKKLPDFMSKEMIISVNGREKKIAILDNGRVSEFYIERGEENTGIAGNIYKGRVQRVLPGMQSAFVNIGLERDAFLYVTDFFDEEEEIERIVMEKSKKISPEEAKREANEKIDRARVEREKQMEAVQELAEPLAETRRRSAAVRCARKIARQKGKRGRGRRGKSADVKSEKVRVEDGGSREPVFRSLNSIDDSGFERVVDDEDTGEMFKDAFMQERIVDQVRAVEFDMETRRRPRSVRCSLRSMNRPERFERIADEDEDRRGDRTKRRRKSRSDRSKSSHGKFSKTSKEEEGRRTGAEAEEKPKKKPAKPKTTTKPKTTRAKAGERRGSELDRRRSERKRTE